MSVARSRQRRPDGVHPTSGRMDALASRALTASPRCLCDISLLPRSYAPPVSAATPLAPNTHSPRPRDGSAGSWRQNEHCVASRLVENALQCPGCATNQHRRVEAAVSVRRGRLAVPAVAGGAYERGIGTMTRNDSENAVSAREASAGYPQAGVNGLERAPHADGGHAVRTWNQRRTLMAARCTTSERRRLVTRLPAAASRRARVHPAARAARRHRPPRTASRFPA